GWASGLGRRLSRATTFIRPPRAGLPRIGRPGTVRQMGYRLPPHSSTPACFSFSMLNVGLIGYGYWGPNLARNLAEADGVRLAAVADSRPDRRKAAERRHPGV